MTTYTFVINNVKEVCKYLEYLVLGIIYHRLKKLKIA